MNQNATRPVGRAGWVDGSPYPVGGGKGRSRPVLPKTRGRCIPCVGFTYDTHSRSEVSSHVNCRQSVYYHRE